MTLYKKTEELITLSENEAKETIEAYNLARNYNFKINMDLIICFIIRLILII